MLKVLVLDSGLKDARQGSTKIFEIFFAQETGLQISYTNLPRNKRGKPSSYKGWHFNLSHSGEYLAMVISDEKEVGIDVEKRL